ncbi:Xylose isomerase-like TIM barrel [Actinopolyspora lacussalsi subsp. righensis]|uniref:Xylose isomerase-like TIM barrel n=1 Tax=Actinopolyspora righensis TaxID=995060 RepID=A0A1I6YG82_9ACTN|nr:sugar phosphate isomerase/epimerase family protein [Actinopolyspora righensis]SFT49412.1 Xylose isomerase-like TIM barrel [Actinopolyspora righensis]
MTGGNPAIGLAEWRLPVRGAEAVELAASYGVRGIQLDFGGSGRGVPLDTPGRARSLRREANGSGVELLAVAGNLLNDIGLTAPERSRAARSARGAMIALLDSAVALGVRLVLVPSFRASTIDGPEELERTVSVLRWAAEEARTRNLVLANENVLSPTTAVELFERVGSDSFRLVLDTGNPDVEGTDVPGLVRTLGPRIADQVHLKDGPLGLGDEWRGSGEIRATELSRAFARSGISVNWLILENDYRVADPRVIGLDVAAARRFADRIVPTKTGDSG